MPLGQFVGAVPSAVILAAVRRDILEQTWLGNEQAGKASERLLTHFPGGCTPGKARHGGMASGAREQ